MVLKKNIHSECFPGGGTHITRHMRFPGTWETHITSDTCSPTQETHIPSDMCSPSMGNTYH